MSEAVIFMTSGFEEIELITTVDILRRAGISVSMVSILEDVAVMGSHDIIVTSDALIDDFDFSKSELFILPGGTTNFVKHTKLRDLFVQKANEGKFIAAICAAPSVLGAWGLLDGKNATCYPGYEDHLGSATYNDAVPVVVDGKTITARGPGFAMDFALQLVGLLRGSDGRHDVAEKLLLEV